MSQNGQPNKNYDFILDNMRYSYSSVNSYNTCPHGFYLTYIEHKPRTGNFFSDFGLHCHQIMELYFSEELDVFELAKYYKDNYEEEIVKNPPPYPKGMAETYYQDGLEFFENFEFDKENYNVISIEDTIKYTHEGVDLIVKPDLVLQDKRTEEYILVDYKTSKLKYNSYDKKKMEGYKRQFFLYIYFIWLAQGIEITKLKVWFMRNQDLVEIPVDPIEVAEAVEWFMEGIKSIKAEKEWLPNLEKSNNYFCDNLCSVKQDCIYKNGSLKEE